MTVSDWMMIDQGDRPYVEEPHNILLRINLCRQRIGSTEKACQRWIQRIRGDVVLCQSLLRGLAPPEGSPLAREVHALQRFLLKLDRSGFQYLKQGETLRHPCMKRKVRTVQTENLNTILEEQSAVPHIDEFSEHAQLEIGGMTSSQASRSAIVSRRDSSRGHRMSPISSITVTRSQQLRSERSDKNC